MACLCRRLARRIYLETARGVDRLDPNPALSSLPSWWASLTQITMATYFAWGGLISQTAEQSPFLGADRTSARPRAWLPAGAQASHPF
jgi:hypothetical protein